MSTEKTSLFVCPNNCRETWFFQDGTKSVRRKLDEEGELIEDEDWDFTPTGSVKCYKCQAEAIRKIKRTTVTTEFVDPK